ncbi:hypothetical protein M408DRAFT_122165 [Serendipita vermifera MAFF 305830]|uniref:Secreted protein n=1 Tax=Serendipita vermifera MAFF 305830 TaxID=933852 RepID=A0A0C3BCY3_SERVB|nr:hypothetical protein M408DRAFT_122165 [Serendipita vermifera MAFF 305830]
MHHLTNIPSHFRLLFPLPGVAGLLLGPISSVSGEIFARGIDCLLLRRATKACTVAPIAAMSGRCSGVLQHPSSMSQNSLLNGNRGVTVHSHRNAGGCPFMIASISSSS